MERKAVSGTVLTLLLISMLALAFNIEPVRSEPTTWTVDDDGPADFHTIQEAINTASSGDTIYVYNGTYYEHIIVNKTVSLVGEDKKTTIIDGNRTGTVVLVEAHNVVIRGFTIQRSGTSALLSWWNDDSAIRLYGGGIIIEGNIITNSLHGVIIGHPMWPPSPIPYTTDPIPWHWPFIENTVISNIIYNSSHAPDMGDWGMGIMMFLSLSSIIRGNTIQTNSSHGIYLENSLYGMISENTVSNVTFGGLMLFNSNNSVIYHNNFISPVWSIGSANIWDDGYPSGGNHWSDYTGVDLYTGLHQNMTGRDGIGDTPYSIDEDNVDRYPLVNPWKGFILGDINKDGKVDIRDITLSARAFGSYPEHPRWNPQADVNQDGKVDIRDLVLIARNFGETYP